MPIIHPFKGLRYNPKKVGSLARVVTPPYDVISPEGRRAYYRAHPCNFIRVVYGKARDPYSEAKTSLTRWVRSGILKRDEEPAVYPYEQAYRLKGKFHRRLGVIALVRIDSKIYPHEHTFGGPKRDRLRLMKRVDASLDPIFGLVPDAAGRYRRVLERSILGRKPAASFRFQGVRHRLWRISDPAWIGKLQRAVRSKDLVIADGHHRFEAARAYREERKRNDPFYTSGASYNFVMFYLSAAGADEPGLLPTHRLVKVSPPARIEIEWLRPGIIEKRLDGQAKVFYTQDLEWACEQVRSGQAQALVVMPPPRLRDVLRRARAGCRMPRKTTYFYPKLLSGLVEYPFETLKGSGTFVQAHLRPGTKVPDPFSHFSPRKRV